MTGPASSPARPAHAGVHFPPPLIYAVAIVIGWLLNRWYALPMVRGGSRALEGGAIFCGLVYLAIFFAAAATFRRARTTLIPNRPANALVTSGPYRFTRNPMYVSLVVLYVGVTLALNSWWPLILLPLVILVVTRAVIEREERYLSAAFPEYAAYRARVRRWL